MNFPIEIKAIAFDLDGTLVETLPDLHEAAMRMLAGIGRPGVDEATVRGYVGHGVDRLVASLLTGAPDGEPDAALFAQSAGEFRRHYANVLTRASHPFPGVVSTLGILKERGFKLACVTNKPARFTGPLLDALALNAYLDLILSGDSLPRKKPDALPLLHCAEVFGIAPRHLLMVGDSPADTGSARAAGCPVFCVPYGYRGTLPVQALDCDAIVPGLSGLLNLTRLARS